MNPRLLFWILWMPLMASATMIQWYCVPGGRNIRPDGSPMSSEYRFELGVFKTGFVPSPDNRTEWSANWVPAQRAAYDPEHGWYTALFRVEDNVGDFKAGREAWVWGFAGDAEAGEWVLFRSTNWKWPRANAKDPVARTWYASQANVVLAGGLMAGDTFLVSAESVEGALPPLTTWTQWIAEKGRPQLEGVPDILRYVLGAETVVDLQAKRLSVHAVVQEGRTLLELRIPRRADRKAEFRIEYSTDLVQWSPAPASMKLHQNDLSEVVYRDETPLDPDGTRVFWRYRVRPLD